MNPKAQRKMEFKLLIVCVCCVHALDFFGFFPAVMGGMRRSEVRGSVGWLGG